MEQQVLNKWQLSVIIVTVVVIVTRGVSAWHGGERLAWQKEHPGPINESGLLVDATDNPTRTGFGMRGNWTV